jgi:hypothetical protein
MDTGEKPVGATTPFKLAVVDQVEKASLSYKTQTRWRQAGPVLVWLRKHGRQDWSKAHLFEFRTCSVTDPSAAWLTTNQKNLKNNSH